MTNNTESLRQSIVSLLDTVKDYPWTGKWRVHKVLELCQHEAQQPDWEQKYNELLQSSKDFMKGTGKYDEILENALNQKKDILDRLIYIQYDPENCGWDLMLNLGTSCVKGQNAIIIKSFAREIHAKQFQDAIMGLPPTETNPAQLPKEADSGSNPDTLIGSTENEGR